MKNDQDCFCMKKAMTILQKKGHCFFCKISLFIRIFRAPDSYMNFCIIFINAEPVMTRANP